MRTRLLRLAALLCTALAVGAVTAATTTPAHAGILPPQFAADSGDRCPYGATKGALSWRFIGTTGPATAAAVDIRGVVVDQPTPTQPRNCPSDGMYSVANFTAYLGVTIMGHQAVRVDDAERAFSFVLPNATTIGRIDRLVVQVCRFPTSPIGISYCGSPKTYFPVATL